MEFWNKCSERLENKLSQDHFNTWIRPLKANLNENILELDPDYCGEGTDNSNCSITNNSLSYLTNTSNAGIIEGIIYSGMFFSIEDELINIKFNVIGSLGDSSSIIINIFEI